MLAIVGKASPNDETGDIEYFIQDFRRMRVEQGRFVYAWSFNPDEIAIASLRQSLDAHEDVFLYLPAEGGISNTRMHVVDFHHDRNPYGAYCPSGWIRYCINGLRNIRSFQGRLPVPIHIWFLMDSIDDLLQPVDLRAAFRPLFHDKYTTWGQNFFAFLRT